jgi:spore coat polysaccharide biosynthesis protein SpsF
VLRRLLDAAELFNLDFIIGTTADNPLFSIYHANLLSDMVRRDPGLDFVYTVGMPLGVNIYAMKTRALKTVCEVKQEVDTEIWGRLINRPDVFNVSEIAVEDIYKFKGIERITLDEVEDYEFLAHIFENFDRQTVPDILSVYKFIEANPELVKLNEHIVQRDLDEATIKRIDAFFEDKAEWIQTIKQRIYAGNP